MGMDVYVSGELIIPANKVTEARDLFLKMLAEGSKSVFADQPWSGKWHREPWTPDDPCVTPEEFVSVLEDKFDRFGVELEASGDLTFGMSNSTRHEEEDLWIFEALAPVIDDGEFCMEGEGYHWKWVVENGELSEHEANTVFDHDENAVPTIAKIVTLIYPDGKPIGSAGHELGLGEYELVIEEIENLLRETGYGPQAGKTELERMADV
jgi:hypothetical protein